MVHLDPLRHGPSGDGGLDLKLGLQNTARYYYYPGWHEPGTVAEFGFNRKAYASFAKFQALLGGWEHVAEGAYHQLLKG